MALESFNVYHSYLDALAELSDAECGRLFKACLAYSKFGEAPKLGGNERFVFPIMRGQIDRDKAAYEEKCAQQSKNASKRWNKNNANEYGGMPSHADDAKDKDNGKDKDKDKDKDKESRAAARFAPPTLEDVAAYCRERGNAVDPQRFIDYYTANGWVVGKNRMEDWRAAVRTWEGRDRKGSSKAEQIFAEVNGF